MASRAKLSIVGQIFGQMLRFDTGKGDESEEDEYEEEFEDAEGEEHHQGGGAGKEDLAASHHSHHSHGSPKKRSGTPGNKLTNSKERPTQGMVLDDYLKGLVSDDDEPAPAAAGGDARTKAMQPLDGLSPGIGNLDQKAMMLKLGFSVASEDSSNSSKKKALQRPSEPLIEEDQAHKVEAFLMELFPERYENKKKPAGGGKKKDKPSKYVPQRHTDDDSPTAVAGAGDVLTNLDSQLKLLRKELKVKDDKIHRLKEHADLMATHMDRLKGEVARLNAKLHEAEMEMEAKEARLGEAVKAKKKAVKKAAGQAPSDRSAGALEAENAKLREREQALLDAVEELSGQNQDLIIKLRESMQRELELSSKRAALVSHSLMPRADSISMLPSIYGKEGHGEHGIIIRSQSEPAEAQQIRGAGKRKKKGT